MNNSGQDDSPLEILAHSQALSILQYLERSDRARFSEIQTDLDLNSAVVDRRLKELVNIGFVRKTHGLYEITPEGGRAALIVDHLNELSRSQS